MGRYDSELATLYREPFWQVGAYWNKDINGKTPCLIGAEWSETQALSNMQDLDTQNIMASTWAVFQITGLADKVNRDIMDETYARIYTEWMPTSNYKRNVAMHHLEVYGPGDATAEDYVWEIWIPVILDSASAN